VSALLCMFGSLWNAVAAHEHRRQDGSHRPDTVVLALYKQDVHDRANVISELLSVKSCCMELSILSDVETDLCMHQLCVL